MIKLINKCKSFLFGNPAAPGVLHLASCREFITASRFYGSNKQGGCFARELNNVTVAARFAHTGGSNTENQQVEITPILVYEYADLLCEKSSIFKQNKGKSGIYCFTNKINGKRYVGSSLDLSKRFKNYFNIAYILDKKDNMNIYKALMAYGFINFKLDILEHCEPSKLIEREQYYLDLLKPEYNILKIAGSPVGVKRSKDTILKLKAKALSRSVGTKAKIIAHLKKLNSSQKHKDHLIKLNTSLEHIAKTAKSVTMYNIETKENMEFRSMTQAAKTFNVHPETIRRCIKKNQLFLDKYSITLKEN